MNSERFISPDAVIQGGTIAENVKIYRWVDIRNSLLGNEVSVGDHSIIIESQLTANIAINRRNFIQQTNIGKYTYTGFNTVIRGVEIGNFCSISWNVSIGGKEHQIENITTSALWAFHNMDGNKMKNFKYGEGQLPCRIGNDVLISSNAVILRGVTIGNGAVIGAGAVVTKDVEPYSVVAGVPAKKIKMRFDNKTIETLEEIQWWNWDTEIIRKNIDLIYSKKVDDSVLKKLKEIAISIK